MNKQLSNGVAFQLLLQSFIVCFVGCVPDWYTEEEDWKEAGEDIQSHRKVWWVCIWQSDRIRQEKTWFWSKLHGNWWSSTGGWGGGGGCQIKVDQKKFGIICKPYLMKLHKLTQIWNRTRPRVLAQNQPTRELISARNTQVQQQRLQLPSQVFVVVLVLYIASANELPCVLILQELSSSHNTCCRFRTRRILHVETGKGSGSQQRASLKGNNCGC